MIFAGAQSGEDLAQHYASGDAFVFISQVETFGNVVVEDGKRFASVCV